MSIIAFCGLKGSGKTTAAEFLVNEFNYTRQSFAGPLKEAAQIIFNLTPQQVYEMPYKEEIDPRWGVSPRELLQRLGTEVGREFDDSIWIKNLLFRVNGEDTTVIDDCRFQNEAEAIKSVGGTVIGIKRPGVLPSSHASELEMFKNWDTMVDITITNDGSVNNLYEKVWKSIGRPVTNF